MIRPEVTVILFLFIFQAQAGLVSTTEFLKVAGQLTNEANYTVWNDLTANLSSLSKLLQNTGFYSSFQTFCVTLYGEISKKVGWDSKEGEGKRKWMVNKSLCYPYGSFNLSFVTLICCSVILLTHLIVLLGPSFAL